MQRFLDKHTSLIDGVLVAFDRLIIHGHLPIAGARNLVAWALKQDLPMSSLAKKGAEFRVRIKKYAQACADNAGRPFLHPPAGTRKEDLVARLIEKDNLQSGLVCVLEAQEMCPAVVFDGREEAPRVRDGRRPCQVYYFYLLDADFGLMHVRLQAWYPFEIQVYVNGHSWLDRQLPRAGVVFERIDNVFLKLGDFAKAQELADSFATLDWSTRLANWARRFNPLLHNTFADLTYAWFIDQAEVATDVVFKAATPFQALYRRLLQHAILCFGAREVLTFLGSKLPDAYTGEFVGDLRRRWQGWRVKFWMRSNALKFYDKVSRVLRVETVLNKLTDFTVRRLAWSRTTKKASPKITRMRKAIEFLPQVLTLGRRINARLLDALAGIDCPPLAGKWLLAVCRPTFDRPRHRVRALNVMASPDIVVLRAVMNGAAQLRGFRNADVRRMLFPSRRLTCAEQRRQAASVTRHLARLRAHGLLAKIPHTHRWRPTQRGLAIMATAITTCDGLWPLFATP